MKPVKPQATTAVDVIYQNIANMPHPDYGVLKLVYFGHQSEGQKKITRAAAEAIVLLLEGNGFHVCNGVADAAALLRSKGYVVSSAEVAPPGPPEGSQVPDGPPQSGAAASSLGEKIK